MKHDPIAIPTGLTLLTRQPCLRATSLATLNVMTQIRSTRSTPRGFFAACRLLLTGALLCGALSGCALFGIKGSKVDWRQVSVIAAQDANNNSPVAVDIVMVADAATLDKLLALRASQWFQDREDLAATYPQAIRYRSWEVVPGETLNIDRRTFSGPRVAGVVVFARYATPGAHRQRVDTYKGRLVLNLKTSGYTLEILP